MSTLIIIPTLNECENLVNLIPTLFRHFSRGAILVVDDDSRDGTEALVEDMRKIHSALHLLIRLGERGYGHAVLVGLEWARDHGYDSVVTMDADFSHDPALTPLLVKDLERFDVVIGSRYVPGGAIENWTLQRKLLSKFSNIYVRAILGVPFHDSTTGFVGYRRTAVQKLLEERPRSEGYAFLVESKYLLYRAGFRIGEHPMNFHERREGTSKMSWKNIWEAIWRPWRLRFFSR